MNAVINALDKAIENKNVIQFIYESLPRTVEPYHYGSLGGTLHLHAYQLSGQSHSGGIPEWRNFEIDKIANVSINKDKQFTPRKSYHPDNSKYTSILKAIS